MCVCPRVFHCFTVACVFCLCDSELFWDFTETEAAPAPAAPSKAKAAPGPAVTAAPAVSAAPAAAVAAPAVVGGVGQPVTFVVGGAVGKKAAKAAVAAAAGSGKAAAAVATPSGGGGGAAAAGAAGGSGSGSGSGSGTAATASTAEGGRAAKPDTSISSNEFGGGAMSADFAAYVTHTPHTDCFVSACVLLWAAVRSVLCADLVLRRSLFAVVAAGVRRSWWPSTAARISPSPSSA
jgi:hypothetical protein